MKMIVFLKDYKIIRKIFFIKLIINDENIKRSSLDLSIIRI